MARRLTNVLVHASDTSVLDDNNLDVSVDCIDEGLYLGNLSCARDYNMLQQLKVTHILTIDLVPLPRSILEHTEFTFKYVKLADVPKEDLINHLPDTNEFIKEAIQNGGVVLVHCYFGVSRSAAVVIGYIMEKYSLCYEDAYSLVKSKRRFICPNVGFIAQLKLFGHMNYKLNKDDPRFKQFRLKMAGQNMKKVKIVPQTFSDLIKADPALVRERPDPIVYRCRRCRRVLASQGNIIPHLPREHRIRLAKKGIRPPPSSLTMSCPESGQILIEKLKSLASQILDEPSSSQDERPSETSEGDGETEGEGEGEGEGYSEEQQHLVDLSVTARAADACRAMWFVEPLGWMPRVATTSAGKLHCPNCNNKVGSFNWIMGCKCPCGQKVAPAFYLVPSKVEWSNIVQNVQVTV